MSLLVSVCLLAVSLINAISVAKFLITPSPSSQLNSASKIEVINTSSYDMFMFIFPVHFQLLICWWGLCCRCPVLSTFGLKICFLVLGSWIILDRTLERFVNSFAETLGTYHLKHEKYLVDYCLSGSLLSMFLGSYESESWHLLI